MKRTAKSAPVKGKAAYRRVLLKLSGEALQGKQGYGIDTAVLRSTAGEIRDVLALGVETAIVVGGGNIFRGMQAAADSDLERANADYIGMLATVMNALAMQDALETLGVETRVQSALEIARLAEPYIRRRAVRHLEKGRVVIFAAGTGNPYFSTDTAASLRAAEIKADILLKATKVDGIYDKDPVKHKNAKFLPRLTHMDALRDNLRVMDATALSLCMENRMPIIVFNMTTPGNIARVIHGEEVGTRVE